jgi:hypothetical protein
LVVAVTDNNFIDAYGNPAQLPNYDVDYNASTGAATVVKGGADGPPGSVLDSLSNLSGCLGCERAAQTPFSCSVCFLRRRGVAARRKILARAGALAVLVSLSLIIFAAGCSDSSARSHNNGDNDIEALKAKWR